MKSANQTAILVTNHEHVAPGNSAQIVRRVTGLDTIRFIAVIWVVFSHCGNPPLTEWIGESNVIGHLLQGVYGNLFPGVPAVIVFFVISGFCIHYPHRSLGSFALMPYLVRRYIRIGVPLFGAILLAKPFNVNLALFQNSVLWSLLAELIYYTVYPILWRVRRHLSWQWMILVSLLIAYGVVIVYGPFAKDYSPFGPALSWIVALPCWLVGCLLAESIGSDAQKKEPTIIVLWRSRLLILGLASLCSVLRFHTPVGYPWTLNMFALAAFFWLRVEIAWFYCREPSRLFEWAGTWSYSIYLIHMIGNAAYSSVEIVDLGALLDWLFKMISILALSYAFYRILERPSHFMARSAGRRLTNKCAL